MDSNANINDSIRQQIALNLSLLLADTYILYAKTQIYYWNASDPTFYSFRLFLKKEYRKLEKAIQQLAERIRELGEPIPAGLKQLLDMTSLKESRGGQKAAEMIQELLSDHELINHFLRERIGLATKLGDEVTANLLIQRLRDHEKSAWMLRSH
jgi:starvation-inducible DNA-binding protein